MSLHPSRGARERWAGVCWCAEIGRGGIELAKLLVDAGAAALLVSFAGEPPEITVSAGNGTADPCVPAIATLGHVSGYSALLAHACISAGAVSTLAQLLQPDSEATVQAKESAAWALAQACRWSAAHAAECLPHKVPENLLRIAFADQGQQTARYLRSFTKIVKSIEDSSALISCVLALPGPVAAAYQPMLSILGRLLPILSSSLAARKELVRRGALGKILEYDQAGVQEVGRDEWNASVRTVKACFPEEVVR
jgi:hypothetical protein